MGLDKSEKEEWLEAAAGFYREGDFAAMRASAREILAHDIDDMDALALLAQASLYLGEEEAAARIVHRVTDADPANLRLLLVKGEMAALMFDMRKAIVYFQKLWQRGKRADLRPWQIAITERAGRLLADASYLMARPKEAADVLFGLVGIVQGPDEKADIYGKALFMLNYQPQDARTAALRERFNSFFAPKVRLPHTKPGGVPDRKMRIGYISPDFREHAVANFLGAFLRNFSKLDFNVFCYMTGHADSITQRFRRSAINWRDVDGLPPDVIAKKIYADRVDILVDFSGHSQGSCLPVLAYKPAPIQISGIGDVGSTGLREVDYFLSDVYCLPPGTQARGFTEKVIRLPHAHLCYMPGMVHQLPKPAREPAAVKNGYVTFGSFNNFAKASRETLVLWRSVLEAVPHSRLIIKGKIASLDDGIAEATERLKSIGIDLGRVELRPYSRDYLEQYADVDIALDTTPYNGGLTTCEALIMGVPVITLKGGSHGSRYGTTILENAGLPELVAASGPEYVKKAALIAGSLPVLTKFHAGLREVMQKSPLMDGASYMKDVERVYRAIWKDYCTRGS